MPNQDDQNNSADAQANSASPATLAVSQDVMDIPPMAAAEGNAMPSPLPEPRPQAEALSAEQPAPEEGRGDDSGSAAPPFQQQNDPAIISSSPKKKFGGGKIIATILGFFLLVGGIAGGVILTQQQQDIREKAGEVECDSDADCGRGMKCVSRAGGRKCVSGGGSTGSTSTTTTTTTNQGGGSTTSTCSSSSRVVSCITASGQAGQKTQTCSAGVWSGGTCVATGGSIGGSQNVTDSQPNRNLEDPTTCQGATTCGGCGPLDSCPSGYTCRVNTCYKDYTASGTAPKCSASGQQCPVGTTCNSNGDCVTSSGVVCSFTGYEECVLDYSCGGVPYTVRNAAGCATGGTPPTTTTTQLASCQNIGAYSTAWAPLTSTDLSKLKTGDQVNFCVSGSATSGSFDRARFTINSVLQAETTAQRPSSQDYCQLYAIPAGTTAITVSAQIHHATLGWK